MNIIRNVLLLSCSTGEGHNSAAYAIENELKKMGCRYSHADPVSFRSERSKELVASLYNNMIKKSPSVFGMVYKIGDIYQKTGIISPVYLANASYADKLARFITSNQFDAVICTHLYGMEAMTALLRRGMRIPTYGVLTDYTCIPFTGETKLGKYFIPHESLIEEAVKKGIPEEKITVSGIPTASEFSEKIGTEEAREKLGLPKDRKIYLTMTGGVGCENMVGFCEALAEKETDKNYLQLVLTGNNKSMKERLDEKYAGSENIKTVAFTRQIHLYMKASNVMVTKPGGLSSTEAAVANVPLVQVNAIPGCESENVRFFSERGMSFYAKNNKEAAEMAIRLSEDRELCERMKENQSRFVYADAARKIAEEVVRGE